MSPSKTNVLFSPILLLFKMPVFHMWAFAGLSNLLATAEPYSVVCCTKFIIRVYLYIFRFDSRVCLAFRDAEAAEVGRMVRLSQGPCAQWQPARQPSVVVTTPPWGARLSDGSDGSPGGEAAGLESAWQELGLFLKVRCMHRASNL